MPSLWTDSTVFQNDLEELNSLDYIPWEELSDKTIFITGGTGLIGSTLISGLLYVGAKKNLNLSVIALCRDEEKAKKQFSKQLTEKMPLSFVEGTVEALPPVPGKVDFIVHAASPTASAYFVEHPVETIKTAVNGTDNILKFAAEKKAKGVLYISSMEAYGSPNTRDTLKETSACFINTMNPRSSYPESKRMCEVLCAAYAKEYAVPAKMIRLSQTFGAGVSSQDKRAFAEFARCALNGETIVLKTLGDSEHPYLYTMDAVSAILTVLLKGETGQVYNAANPDTYCSIREMAEMVADLLGREEEVDVVVKPDSESLVKYPEKNMINMSTEKINALGWKPLINLPEMYLRMVQTM